MATVREKVLPIGGAWWHWHETQWAARAGICTRRVTVGIFGVVGNHETDNHVCCQRWRDVPDCWIHRNQPGQLDAAGPVFLAGGGKLADQIRNASLQASGALHIPEPPLCTPGWPFRMASYHAPNGCYARLGWQVLATPVRWQTARWRAGAAGLNTVDLLKVRPYRKSA
jgi:hypothetical protein